MRVGRQTCLALAKAGCRVLLTYRTNQAKAQELVRELEQIHESSGRSGAPGHSCAKLDLDDLSAVESFAGELAGSAEALDVLVHNASSYDPSPLESLDVEDALRQYRINALAPLLLTARLRSRLTRSVRPGGGSVVCMCDIHAADRPRRDFAAYNLSKAALGQMVLTLALELAPHVRVNGVAPGVVAFPNEGPDSDPQMQERYLRRVPLARSGTPEEAAEAVRWLALDATYTTGMIVRVDGGRWVA